MKTLVTAAARLALAASVVLAGIVSPVGARTAERTWDITKPRGKTRTIAFSVDEGTWMSADVSPDGQWIVFDLLGHIYRVPAKGGRAELLTRDAGIAVNYHPKYSPDGTQIVFVSDRGGQDNLWLMQADGGRPRPLLLDLDSRFAEPDWMPDGRAVVVTRRLQRPGLGFIVTTDTIWRVPVDGTAPEELVGLAGKLDVAEDRWGVWRGSALWNGADRRQWPSASPDGRFVYFHTSPYGGNPRHIQRVDVRTKEVQSVTERKDRYSSDCCSQRPFPLYLTEIAPEVSPDGRWLAFARRIPEGRVRYEGHELTGRTALWLRDLRTGAERVVMDPITRDAATNLSNYQERVLPGYSWSRDSRSIIISEGGRLRRLWVSSGKVETIPFVAEIRREVSEMARGNVRIDDAVFAPRFIRWATTSPNGRELVFEAAGTIYLKSLPGGAPRPLAAPADGEAQLTPAWSPDGSTIAFTTMLNGQGGHVWIADRQGRRRQVTKAPGVYMRPSFSRDGRTLFFDQWPLALTRTADAQEWELARVATAGGAPSVVATPRAASFGDPGNPDVRFFQRPSAAGTDVHRITLASGLIDKVLTLKGAPDEVRLSPDGRSAAVQHLQDVYLLSLPKAADGEALDPIASARRLSQKGGRYPRWRADGSLEFMSAADHVVHHPATGATAMSPTGLSLPRHIGRGTLVLQNARILTMRGGRVIERGDLVITDGRIACVGACAAPATARRLDLGGKTVMPGLVDVHAHAFPDEGDEIINLRRPESAAYLAYGVTTIHDPGGAPVPAFPISDMIEAGRILGPRTYSTGYPLTCTDGPPYLKRIETLDDALDHVDRKARYGVISLKDYLQCTRAQRQMLAEAARMRGLTLTTELGPLFYMIGQAMNGHTGWEHSLQYVLYRDVTEFLGRVGSTYSPQIMLSDFSNGTALEYWLGRTNLLTDPKARLWTSWQRAVARRLFNRKPEAEYLFPVVAKGASRIKAAGGHVAVGAHGEVDGLGTHWEIWTLASGLSNAQALEAATFGSARFLGLDHELGSVEPGKIADLIILERDPLTDIRNTASLTHVMKAGRLYETSSLNELWPDQRPYGPKPWLRDDILQTDVKKSRVSSSEAAAGPSAPGGERRSSAATSGQRPMNVKADHE